MARRLALLFLAIASPLVLVLLALPGTVAESLFSILVVAFPVALIVLAAARKRGLGPLKIPVLALLVILEACTVGMLLLRGRVLESPWFGGLPLAAAIQLYGLWLAPLLLVALTYALTFESFEMSEKDLDRYQAWQGKANVDD